MKIKIGDYVNVQGVSDELFDACVAVAVASGFKFSPCIDNEKVFLTVNHDGEVFYTSGEFYPFFGMKLTIEQWLFSLAPDWAVDIKKMDCGQFIYSDSDTTFISLDDNLGVSQNIKSKQIICARSKPEKWEPKVGEVVTHKGNDNVAVKVVDGCEAWVELDVRGSKIVNISQLKPKPTAEEELIKVLSEEYTSVTDTVKPDSYFECYAKALIKAGYKKG